MFKKYEVRNVFTVVIISQCIYMLNHHVVQPTNTQFLFVSCYSMKLRG